MQSESILYISAYSALSERCRLAPGRAQALHKRLHLIHRRLDHLDRLIPRDRCVAIAQRVASVPRLVNTRQVRRADLHAGRIGELGAELNRWQVAWS